MKTVSFFTVVLWRIFAMFAVLGLVNFLSSGVASFSWPRLISGLALSGTLGALVFWRYRQYQTLDEMEQRLMLESLACSLAISFLVFSLYWVFQAARIFAPMNPVHALVILIVTAHIGSKNMWREMLRF